MRFQHVVNKIEQLLTLSREIEESYDKLTKNGIDTVTNTRVQTRLSDLKEVWGQFSLIHNLVNSSIPELADQEQDEINNHVYFIDRIYERTKEDYLDSLEKFTSLLDGGQSSTTETVSNQSTALPSTSIAQIPIAKLPFIKIPTFDGDPEKWLPFKNLFASLISASTSLSEVEKLQYLKTHLSGSAFDLVKHTALTAENFKQTWDSLTEFFENTRLLVNTTIQSFLNLKRMTKESATELQQLYSNITQFYRTLETLERPVEQCEDFIILISAQKLDAETNKLWESHLGSTRKPPTWKQFKEFLFSRMSSLQSFERSQQKRSLQPTKPNSVQVHHQSKVNGNQKSLCIVCNEKHYISFCPKYNSQSTQQKLAIVSKQKLCYNCLGTHRVSNCRVTKRCQKCGRKHHTSIHQANSSETSKGEDISTEKESPSDTESS